MVAPVSRMIRVDKVWLTLGAHDMRCGMDGLLGHVVRHFESGAQAHHAYIFTNRRANRLKVLVYDGAGLWLCMRRLQTGSFSWPTQTDGSVSINHEQLNWLIAGLPWQRMSEHANARAITVV